MEERAGARAAGLLVLLLASCTGGPSRDGGTTGEVRVARSIEEVQEAYTPAWMDLPGVVGTGIGLCDDQPCIKVFAAGSAESLRDRIPREVEGYRVELEATGPFEARDILEPPGADQDR